MSDEPAVSVILAVYNAERYLVEAVESILNQTFRDFELLAVNDGSTDGSGTILADLARRDSRLRVLDQENRGLVRSLNLAGHEARGRYLARMDADDIATPRRFEMQTAFLDAHPSVGVVGGAIRELRSTQLNEQSVPYPLTDAEIRGILASSDQSPFAHPAVTMRRSAWEAVGGYRVAFIHAEDIDLWSRMAEQTELANLPDVVLHYRVHSGQRTYENLRQLILCSLAARQCARLRRSTGKDPLDGADRITEQAVLAMGVQPSQIERTVVSIRLHDVYRLIQLGDITGAGVAADRAAAEMTRPDVKREIGHKVSAALARTRYLQHRYASGTLHAVQAAVRRTLARVR